MSDASIPVDLHNPGQVFACLGFLEAAHALFGPSRGGFDWSRFDEPRFFLSCDADLEQDPFEAVLKFLVEAELERLGPKGYRDDFNKDGFLSPVETFPAPFEKADGMVLPVRLKRNGRQLGLTCWIDGSSRNPFKLFAGTQRAPVIVSEMREALKRAWSENRRQLSADPLGVTVPLGGSSFKMDARKSWTPIDSGYSPNDQGHDVEGSPVVELLAALGLEHARPDQLDKLQFRYGVWRALLPPVLARPSLGAAYVGVPLRIFRFTFSKAGENKVVTVAREEINR